MDKIIVQEFELEQDANLHIFESELKAIDIKFFQLSTIANEGYFVESEENDIFQEAVSDIINSITNFFKRMIESVKKFIIGIRAKYEEKKSLKVLNDILKDVKNQLAENRALLSGKKVTVFNTKKYIKNYTNFINKYSVLFKKLMTTECNTKDDVNKLNTWFTAEVDKLLEESKLFANEEYALVMSVDEAYTAAENELAHYDEIMKASQDIWERTVINTMDSATDCISKSVNGKENLSDDVSKAHKELVNTIVSESNKFNAIVKNAYRKIAFNLGKTVLGLSEAITAYKASVNTSNKMYDKYMKKD